MNSARAWTFLPQEADSFSEKVGISAVSRIPHIKGVLTSRNDYPPISSHNTFKRSGSRDMTRTLNPFFASCSANSRPMPSDAPVMTAHAPFPAPYFFN